VPVLVNVVVTLGLGDGQPQFVGVGASLGLLAGFLAVITLAHARRRKWVE